MCLNKCPSCNNKISFFSVLSNAMFSVTQEPIKCESCNQNVKPNFSKSIAIAMLPQLFIIPVMNTFNLSALEIFAYAVVHLLVSTAILVCFTSFSIQSDETIEMSENNKTRK